MKTKPGDRIRHCYNAVGLTGIECDAFVSRRIRKVKDVLPDGSLRLVPFFGLSEMSASWIRVLPCLLFLVLALPCAAAGRSAFANHESKILAAIRQAEGVQDPGLLGPAGELGYYRLTWAVWVQYTCQPFALCGTDHLLEARVAAEHLAWLQTRVGPSPYRLGLAWNAGAMATRQGRTNPAQRDYAQRVQNLCFETVPLHP